MDFLRVNITDSDLPGLAPQYTAELFDIRTFYLQVLEELENAETGDEEGVLRTHAKKIAFKLKTSYVSANIMKYIDFADVCREEEGIFGEIDTKQIIELKTYWSMLEDTVEKFEKQIRLVEDDYSLENRRKL